MRERPVSPVGPNLSALSATSLSCHEMVGLTTNAGVRRTEPGTGVSEPYARVHAVLVSPDGVLGRTGNATVESVSLNTSLMDVLVANVTGQSLHEVVPRPVSSTRAVCWIHELEGC
jgi:hypothetical protein